MPSPSSEAIIQAVTEAHGMVAVAARSLGVERKTVYRRAEKSPAIQEAIADAREIVSDTAELALFKAIDEGHPWAVCFYLKTQGKDRGYTEKSDLGHSGEVTVKVIYAGAASGADPGSF
jgi:hypothetical protein